MERVRGYLNDDGSSMNDDADVGARTTDAIMTIARTTPLDEQRKVDEDETKSFLSSGRIDGRSSDAKSIGSLSQHFFESDDNEDEKYCGTCNGYTSHPGSKSNLLLCSECDSRSRTCNYRPQTPSQCGRFVEERIERQAASTRLAVGTRNQQERRASTISSIMKSPMKVEGSPRYCHDETNYDRGERRSKSIAGSLSCGSGGSPRKSEQERTRKTCEHQCDLDLRHHDQARSPCMAHRSPLPGNSSRYHDVEQRGGIRRIEQLDDDTNEGKVKRTQERYQDSRSPVQICDRSRREADNRVWTVNHEHDETESEERDYHDESENNSPPCPLCNVVNGNNCLSRCAHCNISSDQDDADLICFRCQMSADEETTSVEGSICRKCENAMRHETNGSCQTTSSSSDGTKFHVDAVVKIHVNNRSIDVDSDDTFDSDPSNNRDSGEAGNGSIDRLETIVEAKNDTASENGDENGTKINGQPRTKYLNYMIVLLL